MPRPLPSRPLVPLPVGRPPSQLLAVATHPLRRSLLLPWLLEPSNMILEQSSGHFMKGLQQTQNTTTKHLHANQTSQVQTPGKSNPTLADKSRRRGGAKWTPWHECMRVYIFSFPMQANRRGLSCGTFVRFVRSGVSLFYS